MVRLFVSLCVTLIFLSSSTLQAGEPMKFPHPEKYTILKRDSREFKEIKGVFDKLLDAARKGDIGGVMTNYSRNYLNSGREVTDIVKQWKQILDNFDNLELNHPIYTIEVSGNFARMRCEGVLMGRPKKPIAGETAESVIIDSWKLAVHNLIKENDTWKVLGDQIPYDTGRTFHPLF